MPKSQEKPTPPKPCQPDLRDTVHQFATRLRRKFCNEFEQDTPALRTFKRRVLRLLKTELPPGPGRPPEEAITLAVELRAEGKTWPEVYRACIAGFDNKSADSKIVACSRLRSAARSRRNARRQRKTRRESSAEKPLPLCSV